MEPRIAKAASTSILVYLLFCSKISDYKSGDRDTPAARTLLAHALAVVACSSSGAESGDGPALTMIPHVDNLFVAHDLAGSIDRGSHNPKRLK